MTSFLNVKVVRLKMDFSNKCRMKSTTWCFQRLSKTSLTLFRIFLFILHASLGNSVLCMPVIEHFGVAMDRLQNIQARNFLLNWKTCQERKRERERRGKRTKAHEKFIFTWLRNALASLFVTRKLVGGQTRAIKDYQASLIISHRLLLKSHGRKRSMKSKHLKAHFSW